MDLEFQYQRQTGNKKKIAEYMAFQVVISLTKENKVGKRNSETERKALIIRMVREDFLRK